MATTELALPARPRNGFSFVAQARIYGEFMRVGFVNTIAYRLRYYTGIVTYFLYVSVYYFIWKAIYEHSASIEGFDFSHLLTYVAVGWIIRSFYYNNIDQDIAAQVLEGKLAMDLIKPVNPQWMYIAQALGESVFPPGHADRAHGGGAAAGLSGAQAGEPGEFCRLPGQRVS